MSELKCGCPSCITDRRTLKVMAIKDANGCQGTDPVCDCRCHALWDELMANRQHWVAAHDGLGQVAGG